MTIKIEELKHHTFSEISEYIKLLQEENRQLKERLKPKELFAPAKGFEPFDEFLKNWTIDPRKKYDLQVITKGYTAYFWESEVEAVEYESSSGGRKVEFKFTSPYYKESQIVTSGSAHLYHIKESSPSDEARLIYKTN